MHTIKRYTKVVLRNPLCVTLPGSLHILFIIYLFFLSLLKLQKREHRHPTNWSDCSTIFMLFRYHRMLKMSVCLCEYVKTCRLTNQQRTCFEIPKCISDDSHCMVWKFNKLIINSFYIERTYKGLTKNCKHSHIYTQKTPHTNIIVNFIANSLSSS